MGANSGSLANLKKVGLKDKETQKLQQNIENAIEPIISKEIIDGVLCKDICLKPNIATEVEHSLGRKPLGWIVVRKRADARIWDVQDFNNNPSRSLSLATSHEVKVDLWIF